MKRSQIIGLCLMATSAFSAIMVASAFASPEFSPANGGFTGNNTTPTLKTTLAAGATNTHCSSRSEGEISGAMEISKVMITYTGCSDGGISCNSKISAAEEALYGKQETGKIVTKELMGVLGWANKTGTIVGLLLLPTAGSVFMEFECTSAVKIVVTGNVIGELTPFKSLVKEFRLKFSETAGKTQELTTIELLGGVEDTASLLTEINGSKPGTATTLMSEETLTLNSGTGEIK